MTALANDLRDFIDHRSKTLGHGDTAYAEHPLTLAQWRDVERALRAAAPASGEASMSDEFFVDGDKLRVMYRPAGGNFGGADQVVCLCACEAGGSRVAVRIAEMLNGRRAESAPTAPVRDGWDDPADLWDAYCAETDVDDRSAHGAMAFAFDALTRPAIEAERDTSTPGQQLADRFGLAGGGSSNGAFKRDTGAEAMLPLAKWAIRNPGAVSETAADELIVIARNAVRDFGAPSPAAV